MKGPKDFDVYDGHKVSKDEFAEKIAQAIFEIKSSSSFFILQYAFGEMEWSSAEDILNGIIKDS